MFKSVIFCLIGIVTLNICAAARIILRRDVSHGYAYQPGHTSGGGSLLTAPTSLYQQSGTSFGTPTTFSSTSTSFYPPTASANSYFSAVPPFSAYNANEHVGNANIQQQHYDIQQPPIITKHFYIHSAPEDYDEQQIVRYINVGRPQKDYKVIFIKAPSSSVSKAKIIAKLAPVEDKTAIYVLAKKSNDFDIETEVVTPAPTQHKPEVFFIKYKTPAEAEHAQHVIQSQYDSLGGTNQVINEGTVPVSSVIGSLGGSDGSDSVSVGTGVNIMNTGDNTQQTYLPSQNQ